MKKSLLLLLAITLISSCKREGNKEKNSAKTVQQSLAKDSVKIAHSPQKSEEKADAKDSPKSEKLLFPIVGTYQIENRNSEITDCKMVLKISQKNEKFRYLLKTESRTLQGDISLDLNEEKDGYYITFKNIPWSEYKGTIELDEDGNEIEHDYEVPNDIQGVLYKNEIDIQNTGNAMNYYVKFEGCDLKFIHLVRK